MDLRADFLEGMSRAATFVAVATTDGEGGRFGVTVSSLTSVSADGDQPSLLLCVHQLSPVGAAILKNRAFCANLLAETQQDFSNLFAGRGASGDHADRFTRAAWEQGRKASPCLQGPRPLSSAVWQQRFCGRPITSSSAASLRCGFQTTHQRCFTASAPIAGPFI